MTEDKQALAKNEVKTMHAKSCEISKVLTKGYTCAYPSDVLHWTKM